MSDAQDRMTAAEYQRRYGDGGPRPGGAKKHKRGASATSPQQRGRRNRAAGEAVEDYAADLLRRLGLAMIERVHTPWKVVRGKGGAIKHAFPVEKVSGDFRAVLPSTGQSVLVEVKSRAQQLCWSDFRPHQREALTDHDAAGGLSLVVWHEQQSGTVHVFAWPCPRLTRGDPLGRHEVPPLPPRVHALTHGPNAAASHDHKSN